MIGHTQTEIVIGDHVLKLLRPLNLQQELNVIEWSVLQKFNWRKIYSSPLLIDW